MTDIRHDFRPFALLLVALALPFAPRAAAQDEALQGEAALLQDVRQLTFEGRRAGEGYFGPDGTKMVFQSERDDDNPFYQIWLMDLGTGDVERVSTGVGKTTCAWIHPDGRRVLYASTHLDPRSRELQKAELDFRASGQTRRYEWDYDPAYELFAADLETGEHHRLTYSEGYDAEGSYSPDGAWICFASNRAAYTEPLSEADAQRFAVDRSLFMDLYLARADGSEVRRLTFARGYDGGPFFSQDGSRICWRRFSEDGLTAEIWTMDARGGDQRALTRMKAMSWAPFFHPSGAYLIFTSNVLGFSNFELYIVDAAGRLDPVRVTHTDGFDGLPTFSPDGETLSWTSNRAAGGTSQIFMARWNHAEALRLLAAAREAAGVAAPTTDEPAETGAATAPEYRAADLKLHVFELASERMEGRFTGSEGERLATAYVAAAFERFGLEPAGDDDGWFAPFTARVATHGGATQEFSGRNVIGRLSSGARGAGRPAVVVGAHVDHLGTAGAAWSTAQGDARSELHLGADDNASGVAAVLEIAEHLADLVRRGELVLERDVIFAAWSGEEAGLLGSRDWMAKRRAAAGDPEDMRAAFAACINLDMVGRLDEHLIVSGVGSSPSWRGEIERRNVPVGLPLSLVEDPHLPTDSSTFYLAGVPVLSVFTGAHADYHKPSDTPDKLDYPALQRIARFVGLLVRGLATSATAPEYAEVARKPAPTGGGGQRLYLGTIPDYAEAEIPGMALSGVSPGGPAEAAGLKAGDVIVELGGKKVEDVYGFMTAMSALEPGKAVEIVVVRDGAEKRLAITPGTRE